MAKFDVRARLEEASDELQDADADDLREMMTEVDGILENETEEDLRAMAERLRADIQAAMQRGSEDGEMSAKSDEETNRQRDEFRARIVSQLEALERLMQDSREAMERGELEPDAEQLREVERLESIVTNALRKSKNPTDAKSIVFASASGAHGLYR